MKKSEININVQLKRFRRKLKSKEKKKEKKIKKIEDYRIYSDDLESNFALENLIDKWMPKNLKFLLTKDESFCNMYEIGINSSNKNRIEVPEYFSLIENPNESFGFLKNLISLLLTKGLERLDIDYKKCENVDLGAQVVLDIIIKDMISFYKKCSTNPFTYSYAKDINGININNDRIKKLLYSVGSRAIHLNYSTKFKDVIPYALCVHDRDSSGDEVIISEQKDIDTTNLVDYVLECLARMGKKLSDESLDDLCVVISEILINAEEHSSTSIRYSIGYFQDEYLGHTHNGIFRLVILNFGETIYDKFKSPDCPNKETVKSMKVLSEKYTSNFWFKKSAFEEETLWTLYSLQEGVTSIAPDQYKKRGNGSIRFIESFFNLSDINSQNGFSKLALLSGNSKIIFDGKYNIREKINERGDKFKVMTFNNTGNIEDAPDLDYVNYTKFHFPGTMISVKIMFNDDNFMNDVE